MTAVPVTPGDYEAMRHQIAELVENACIAARAGVLHPQTASYDVADAIRLLVVAEVAAERERIAQAIEAEARRYKDKPNPGGSDAVPRRDRWIAGIAEGARIARESS